MKTYIITITILVLAFFQVQAQQVFTEVGSFPNYSFFSVHFPTSQTGYAAGGNYSSNMAVIVKTTDSGQTWSIIDSETNRLPYREIYFFDDNHGFAIAENTPVVYVTSDGGNQWQTVVFPSLDRIRDVSEANGNLYLTGSGGNFFSQLYVSTDKGTNWTLTYQSNTTFLNKIFFIDSQTGWSAGYELYKTTDAGATWQQIPNVAFGDFVMDVVFKNSMIGFTAGFEYEYGLSRTMDGGNTWQGLFFVPYSNFVATYNNAVYAGGMYGSVFCSFDLGDTLVELTASAGINDIHLFDEYASIAVGNNGKIYLLDTSSLSVENPKLEKNITIFPNPVGKSLCVDLPTGIKIQSFKLFDIQGRQISISPPSQTGKNFVLDIRSLATGEYFLQIQSNKGKTTKKILIK